MSNNPSQNDELWILAKKRAKFKKSAFSYLIINAFLIGIWFVTAFPVLGFSIRTFWPVWVILGWGIGLGFQYADAYLNVNIVSTEREYEKLKNEKK
ncbi:MAG: hypothetical protein EAZ47_10745 [Bacteroidetes bacterium]|nr:MAG: hypothetical protein EAY72_07065 [Bacteroidota bacterium]TAE72764.1 MAG: hypothetical protein EAY68_00360 [Bacteroidota bacterium]TAF90806.1 MAG: hypothetical protein EAZ47_10745 [Bacteroidota bacterium]